MLLFGVLVGALSNKSPLGSLIEQREVKPFVVGSQYFYRLIGCLILYFWSVNIYIFLCFLLIRLLFLWFRIWLLNWSFTTTFALFLCSGFFLSFDLFITFKINIPSPQFILWLLSDSVKSLFFGRNSIIRVLSDSFIHLILFPQQFLLFFVVHILIILPLSLILVDIHIAIRLVLDLPFASATRSL